ncbi:MAG: sigma-70 family RNA polymerase sigma factor [Deferribacteres bacterium]|nr:sigma-70 family RNA polymerase sigma factor [Deferribacteres bacterium]
MQKGKIARKEMLELLQARSHYGSDSIEVLVQKYKFLIYGLAQKLLNLEVQDEFDDLVQKGYLGLFEAINKYSKSRVKSAFTTYVYGWIKANMMDGGHRVAHKRIYCRSCSSDSKKIYCFSSFNGMFCPACGKQFSYAQNHLQELSLNDDVLDGVTFQDIIPSYDPDVLYQTELKELWQIVDTLPERFRGVIKKRYLQGKTLSEIGADYNITKEAVRQREKKALKILKKRFCMERSYS